MAKRFQAPKGTRDLLPPETAVWAAVEATARRVFGLYGYREIRTPIFEDTELFRRGVGEATDVVGKQMYSFEDRARRKLTLRPESTAAVCRAYVEHGLQQLPQPVRLYYVGPQFRYERPQKGRSRQFHQIGAEILGGRSPEADVEILAMLVRFLGALGFRDLRVLVNTVGDAASRRAYREALTSYLLPVKGKLSEDSRRRLDSNPLRILDSKRAEDQAALENAPRMADSLTPEARTTFEQVTSSLVSLGVPHSVEPRLVRGLDYYTHTVFEIVSEGLGAQNAICGGGAYGALVEELGGPSTYATGFAIGEDRLVEVLPADSAARRPEALPARLQLVGPLEKPTEGERIRILRWLEALREAGVPVIESRSRRRSSRSEAATGHAEAAPGRLAEAATDPVGGSTNPSEAFGPKLILGPDELGDEKLTIVWPDGMRESLPRSEGLRKLAEFYGAAPTGNGG